LAQSQSAGKIEKNKQAEMKPPPFSYHDPRTTADVVGLLASLDNAKLLAGGQSLMPMLNMRYVLPDHIVDLNRVDGMSFIRERDGALEIGAMTRQRDIEFSDIVRERCPLMHEAIVQVGHRQTRNRGTLGGSLCHLDPSAELVSVAAALDAKVAVTGKNGVHSIDFSAFPVGYMTPALDPDELLTGATFPCWPRGHGYAFVEFSRRHGDFAIVSAAVLIEEDRNGKVTRASVTLGGMGPAPVRASEVERALVGETIEDKRLREICETLRKFDAIDDIHAPSAYRQQLATVLARRALIKAHERIAEGSRS
jgi:carbon-monoxide dehydrogenase medium subunit